MIAIEIKNLLTVFFLLFGFLHIENLHADFLNQDVKLADEIINSKLSNEQKVTSSIKYLKNIRQKYSNKDYSLLVKKMEPILFLDLKDSESIAMQVTFILTECMSYDFWPYSRNKIDVLDFTKKVNEKNSNSKDSKLIKFVIDMYVARLFFDEGKMVESLEVLDTLTKDINSLNGIPEGIEFALLYAFDCMKLKIFMYKNDYSEAKKISNRLDRKFDKLVKIFSEGNYPTEFFSYAAESFYYEIFIGNNQKVINRINVLLQKIPEVSKDNNLIKARLKLIETLKNIKMKSKSKAKWLDLEAKNLREKSGDFDIAYFVPEFLDAIFNADFEKGQFVINSMDFYCKNANFGTDEGFVCKNFIQIMDDSVKDLVDVKKEEDLRVAEIIAEHKADFLTEREWSECRFKPGNNRKICSKLRKDIEKDNYLIEEIGKTSADIYRSERGLLRSESFLTKYAHELEAGIYKTTITSDSIILGLYESLAVVYDGLNQKEYAAFYAKKYINLIQKIRSSINNYDKKSLVTFTQNQADILRKFSLLFFETEDYESAIVCLRIIKENQFLDFVRRDDASKKLLSFLNYSNDENDYQLKISTIYSEIGLLENALSSKNRSESDLAIFRESLKEKKQDLIKLRESFVKARKAIPEDHKAKQFKNFSALNNIHDDEAFIYIGLSPKAIFSYLATKNGIKYFSYDIDRLDLLNIVNDVSSKLTTNKKINNLQLIKLSEIIIKKPFEELSRQNVKSIKVIQDSRLIGIPLSIYFFDQSMLVKKYSFEYLSFYNNSKTAIAKHNNNLDLFGATLGNFEFSPLPGVKEEIDLIMKSDLSFKIPTKNFYLNNEFTKTKLINSFSNNTGYIHLATHFKSDGNAENSTKLLLGDKTTLSIEELRSQLPEFNSKLVTLSACETGNLLNFDKDNIFEGLASIFELKGAKNVLSTLWSISDRATSKFMTLFYSILANNDLTPSQALMYSQIAFKEGSIKSIPNNINLGSIPKISDFDKDLYKYKNPYYWASFQIFSSN
jgi:CHAT domain-containing protein